jgi:hypothetical protein
MRRLGRFVPVRRRGSGSCSGFALCPGGLFGSPRGRGRGRGLGLRPFFFGALALGLGSFQPLLLFLALAILLGQLGQLALVLFLRFLQLAQRFFALAVHDSVGRHRATLDVGAPGAHFHVDGLGAGAAPTRHGDLADLAALQRDLAWRNGSRGRLLAVVAAQEIKQLGFFAIADDLVRAVELHAGFGKLRQQLVLGRAHHARELLDRDI